MQKQSEIKNFEDSIESIRKSKIQELDNQFQSKIRQCSNIDINNIGVFDINNTGDEELKSYNQKTLRRRAMYQANNESNRASKFKDDIQKSDSNLPPSNSSLSLSANNFLIHKIEVNWRLDNIAIKQDILYLS
ncbi:MAG: hypothetical protein MHMPM18_004724 [Marteilia pararefringens]